MPRRLIYVPVVHTQADLGSAAERLDAIGTERLGAERWRAHQQQVADFWERLNERVLESVEDELAGAGWESLRVFQDGLPAGGEMGRRIVKEVAQKGSPNYRIVEGLLERGAHLEQTEDPALLREEYEMIREIAAAPGPPEAARAERAYGRRSRRGGLAPGAGSVPWAPPPRWARR